MGYKETTNELLKYVTDTPQNTNPNIVQSMAIEIADDAYAKGQEAGGGLPTGEIGQILRQGDGEYEFTDQCFYIQIQLGNNISVEDLNDHLTSLEVQNKDELLEYLDSDRTIPCKVLFEGTYETCCYIDGDYINFLINTEYISGQFFINVIDDCCIYSNSTISIPKTTSCKIYIDLSNGWQFNFDEQMGVFYVIPDFVQSNFGGASVDGFNPTWFNDEQAEIEVYINNDLMEEKVERLPNVSRDMPVFFNKQNNLCFSLVIHEIGKGEEVPTIILLPIITYEGLNEKYINCGITPVPIEDNTYMLLIDSTHPFPINMFNGLYEAGYVPKLYPVEENNVFAGYVVQESEEYDLFAQGTDTVHNIYTTIELNEYLGDLPDPELASFCIYEGTITTHEFSEGGGSELPDVTISDSGKVLGVNIDGEWDVLEQRVSTKYKVTNEDLEATDPDTGLSVAASKFFDPMITDIYFDQFLIYNHNFITYIDEIGNHLTSLQYNSIIPATIHAYNLTSNNIGHFVYTEGLYGSPTFIFQYINCFGDLGITYLDEDATTVYVNNSAFFIRTEEQERGATDRYTIDIPLSKTVVNPQQFRNWGIERIYLNNRFSCDLCLSCWNTAVE